jgi:hypothetical protein
VGETFPAAADACDFTVHFAGTVHHQS